MSTQTRATSRLRRTPAHAQDPAPARHATSWGALVRHYLEMVLAMAFGMVVLHPIWPLGLDALGFPGALHHATVMAMVMATDMSLGMGAWMRFRGHTWRPIVEMSATMYLPFAVFLPPVYAGAMSGGAMITAGHLLMLPAMLALMLWRRDEYSHGHHSPSHTEPAHSEAVVDATDEAVV
jgi:hypothetical protein